MNKTFEIFRHEVWALVSRFSFWFGLLGVPFLGFLILGGVTLIKNSQGGDASVNPLPQVSRLFTTSSPENRPQGYVDQAGLIRHFPTGFNKTSLMAYADVATAQRDLESGKIGAYYVISPNYVQDGKLYVYTAAYDLVASEQNASDLRWLINDNLLNGDAALADEVRNPLPDLQEVNLSPQNTGLDRNSDAAFFLPYGMLMLFFMSIMGSSSMLLGSVAKEKENRIMEILLNSASPHQMLMGKIIGLGLVGLLQIFVWLASALALLRLGGGTFNLPAGMQLPPSILAWGLLFFLLGYLVYAALMAGVGALVPSLREASQASFIIMLPIMAPLFLISALIQNPDGGLAVAFSLFPLTASTTMMLRLTAGSVPIWQLLLAVVLLIITALLVIRAVAGMFRAQTIMSGQAFNLKRFFLALIGKA